MNCVGAQCPARRHLRAAGRDVAGAGPASKCSQLSRARIWFQAIEKNETANAPSAFLMRNRAVLLAGTHRGWPS